MHTVTILPVKRDEANDQQNVWDPDDLLFVPLLSGQGEPIGMISEMLPQLAPDPIKRRLKLGNVERPGLSGDRNLAANLGARRASGAP